MTDLDEWVRELLQRDVLTLAEAENFLIARGYSADKSRRLLIRAVTHGDLQATIKPQLNRITRNAVNPVDPHLTTVSTAALLEWVDATTVVDRRELHSIGLTREQWDSMSDEQRQTAVKGIAEVKAYSRQVAQQEAEKRARGRYQLEEAAEAIAATGERHKPMLKKLCDAAFSGDLPTYWPGQNARYEYKNRQHVRPHYEECYWSDLNAWLEKEEPRIKFRFPAPDESDLLRTDGAEPRFVDSPGESQVPGNVTGEAVEPAPLWSRRQPARLFDGPGFSEEALKQTTLSPYLNFDTWTPAAAAMLVCGLQALIIDGQLSDQIPKEGAMGLDNCFVMGYQDPFHEAKHVLGIWRAQVNPPARVRPLDFIQWCKARGMNPAWLRCIEEAVEHQNVAPIKTLTASIRTIKKKGEKWSDVELRTLLEEINQPSTTQTTLASKYGVSRQRIGATLKQARDKFAAPAKASPFPSVRTTRRNRY